MVGCNPINKSENFKNQMINSGDELKLRFKIIYNIKIIEYKN